jgi:hypothetical protein
MFQVPRTAWYVSHVTLADVRRGIGDRRLFQSPYPLAICKHLAFSFSCLIFAVESALFYEVRNNPDSVHT